MDEKKAEKPTKLALLKELKRIVDITRRCRTYAANRLMSRERFLQAINIYYSCVTIIISMLEQFNNPSENHVNVSIYATIVLSISIVYLNAQKFERRANDLQMNYIDLQKLGFDIDDCIEQIENGKQIYEISTYKERYTNLLRTSENHIAHDYRCVQKYIGDKEKERKLKGWERFKYCIHNFGNYSMRVVLCLIPVAYFILYFYNVL